VQLGPALNERKPIDKNVFFSSTAQENIIQALFKNYSLGGAVG